MVDEVGTVKGLRDYGVKEEYAHAKDAKPRQEYGAQTRDAKEQEKGNFRLWILYFSPRLRDALSRAKDAKPRRGSGRRRGTQRPDRVGVKAR